MRTLEDICNMAAADYSIGLEAHYKPLANLINDRGYKSIIEIGTAYGGNALHLLNNTNIEDLICIDPYIFYPAMPGFTCQEEYDTLYQFAQSRIGVFGNAIIVKKTSREAFLDFAQEWDMVFIDGNHAYEDVKWECENYSNIIRPGGVLAGHDYNIFEGVNKAVDQFAAQIHQRPNLLHGNIWYFNL